MPECIVAEDEAGQEEALAELLSPDGSQLGVTGVFLESAGSNSISPRTVPRYACWIASVIGPTGKPFTEDSIGMALATRNLMDDLRSAEVDFLTIGQYLQPTRKHHAVMRYVTPDEFAGYEKVAYTKGFLMVSASPLTRSSHHAGDDFARLRAARAALSG